MEEIHNKIFDINMELDEISRQKIINGDTII
jgi:hypothetical protein